MKRNNIIEESFIIKINLYGEDIDLNITSNFRLFCKNICKQLKITLKQLNSIILSYNDEDGDNIILSTEEDYNIFFRGVKDNKIAKKILIEFKDKIENDSIMLSDSNVDIQNKHSGSINNINNNIIDSKNNINIKNNINNNIIPSHLDISDNKINDINNNNNNNNIIINKSNSDSLDKYILDDYIKQIIKNDESIKKNEDIIFYYECSYCQLYPLLFKMYYCPICVLYFCEECKKNINNHNHDFITITSKEQLVEIKNKENLEIEKKNKNIIDYHNNNNNNPNKNKNNPNNNYNNYNHNHNSKNNNHNPNNNNHNNNNPNNNQNHYYYNNHNNKYNNYNNKNNRMKKRFDKNKDNNINEECRII